MKSEKVNQKSKLEEEFIRCKGGLFWFTYRLTGCHDEAQDILQDAFVKTYQYQEAGNKIANVKSFLYQTTFNLYQDKLRRVKRHTALLVNLRKSGGNDHDVENDFFKAYAHQQINLGLRRLKKKERSIILLYLDQFSYQEISSILGIKKTSVGKTLARAIDRLHQYINKGELK